MWSSIINIVESDLVYRKVLPPEAASSFGLSTLEPLDKATTVLHEVIIALLAQSLNSLAVENWPP